MELVTFQWIAGIALSVMGGLIMWIARDFNEKIKELREELREANKDRERLRDLLDKRSDDLHSRINEMNKTVGAQSVTLAGYQGTFMTREEHARHCQQTHQARP